MRAGQVRVLLGSTAKMGAGTNVQDKLIALHDLDCPWRPSDLQQRLGRIVRQGNENEEVEIYRYVTEEMCIRDRYDAANSTRESHLHAGGHRPGIHYLF